MRLDALLMDRQGRTVAGVIHDFCAGGVFMVIDMARPDGGDVLAEGEGVTVNVSVRDEDFAITARVVRRLSNGVGLAFRNPDRAALSALQKMAIDSHRRVSGVSLDRAPEVNEILEACRHLARDALSPLIRHFNAHIGNDLVDAAAAAASNVEQSRYFDAATAIKPMRAGIEAALRDQLPDHVMELGRFALQPSDILEATWSGSLSLVDEDIFEDFLALSEIAVRANDRYTDRLQELNRRFSRLAGTSIEQRTNPLSPEAVCEVFRDAIKDLRAHRTALLVIYRSFETHVVKGLGELYDTVNQLLAERGVEPAEDQRLRVVRTTPKGPSPGHVPRESPTAAAPREHAGEQAPEPHTKEAGASWPVQPVALPSGADDAPARPAPAVSAVAAPAHSAAAPAGEGAASALTVSAAELAERSRVIDAAYHTAQRLLDMEQGLIEHTQELTLPHSMVTQGAGASSYSSREVADGLADLQERLPAAEAGGLSFDEMEDQLFRQLMSRHPEHGRKRLAQRERNNIRLITNLLTALLSDDEVAEAVKERIRRLRVPIHRVGLEDENFITDQNHTARQVLDKLAGLEMDMEVTGGVVGDHLDALVERILDERQDPARAFEEALPEVEALRQEQAQVYSSGIADVVKECRQRAEFMRSRRKEGQEDPPARRMVGTPQEQQAWRQWTQRVDRLKEGDALIFDRGTPAARRGQLVWVDDSRDEFVFVDGRGRKSDALSAHELAMGLRRGTVEVLPPHSLSPVERAMLDMLRGAQERLQREATHEPLTGLPNQREFRRLLADALHRAVQEKTDNVVGYLSLDGYKDVFRRLGSDAASELLRVASAVLEEAGQGGQGGLGFADLGQGRFGMLLEDATPAAAGERLEPLLQPGEDDALEWEGENIPVSFVIGVAELGPDTESVESALEEATRACHRARSQGGMLGVASDGEKRAQRKRLMADWAGRLNATLKEDRLLLRAQKVAPLEAEGGARPFYELLLGLRDEDGEAISPREFLEAAEYYNQLLAVDRWVIRNVIHWLSGNPPGLDRIDGFTINLSGASLVDETLGDYVLELLLESSAPPGRLCFEVSQSDALAHHSNAEQFIRTVTDLGCRIALHNFGHGDSSYAYLKDLPVDYIKIGGSFVAGMARSPSDHAVVNSINEIAHMMGKRTVAEHVESEAAMVRLRDMGVDFAQGYYVARPRYLEELMAQGLDG